MAQSRLYLTIALGLIAVFPASAEKKWYGKVTHAPILADRLAGARVRLRTSGRCARDFTELLKRDLAAHQISVITEVGVAKVLAPTVVFSIEISRCEALPREPILGPGLPALHISRTEGHFVATLRVLDPSNGEEVVTQTLRADSQKENQSPTSVPEYPAPADLLDIVVRQAVGESRHLYAPWVESQELTFMDDKQCNLRQAWDLLKTSDYRALVSVSLTNAKSCQASPKTVAAAWYNLGVAYMLVQNYAGAISALERSRKVHELGPSASLLAECRKNKSFAEAVSRYVIGCLRQMQVEAPVAGKLKTGILFSNDLVIRLVQGNVADEDILKMIATQPNRFAVGQDDLVKLKQAGVSDAVVAAIRQTQVQR